MNLQLTSRIVLILGILLWEAGSIRAQKTLLLENITPLEPVIINDVANFQVVVGVVNNLSMPDTVTGDIYYWFLTDSMILAGAPPRKLEQDFVSEMVYDGFIDIVPIDIQPDEWRTEPANLIILWPAMIDPSVVDTHSLSLFLNPFGFLGIPQGTEDEKDNKLFPCPVIQLVYIQPTDLPLIKEIIFYRTDGSVKTSYKHDEFASGCINLDTFPSGIYITELHYFDHRIIRIKIQKR